MAKHIVGRASGGEGMSGWLQAVCSCGWKSTVEYAYEDYQHTTVRGYENRHIRDAAEADRTAANSAAGQEGAP